MKVFTTLLLGFIFLLNANAADPTKGLTREQLKDKLTLVQAKLETVNNELVRVKDANDTLVSENRRLVEIAMIADSSKQELVQFWEQNKPLKMPDNVWGIIAMVFGLIIKFIGTPIFASMSARYLKVKTNIGELLSDYKGDNSGFWIVTIVCLILGLGVEAFFTGALVDFNFLHALKNSAIFFTLSNLFYHGKMAVKNIKK